MRGTAPPLSMVPATLSPTVNVPCIISISISFGVQNLLTSTLSKNEYNLVNGLNALPSKAILRDLIKLMISVLITLVPSDSVSILSLTVNC